MSINKKIIILGSTGSIGRQALEIIDRSRDKFEVVGISAKRSIDELLSQAERFNIKNLAIDEAKSLPEQSELNIFSGRGSSIELIKEIDCDVVLNAIVGSDGLLCTVETLKRRKVLALANKESLVAGGTLIMDLLKSGDKIIPVDSEHSALFQCFESEKREFIEEMILTASGGPFFGKTIEDLQNVTVEQALKHPNWEMGNKITVDSATLMNKGLEILEAHFLFKMPLDKIKILIHPQSIVHGMISFIDGTVKSVLAIPDMRIPIAYALTYPDRLKLNLPAPDFQKIGSLEFYVPDIKVFKSLDLAYEAGKSGKTYPAVFSAANEAAVEAFLQEQIKFLDIVDLVEKALQKHDTPNVIDIETIIEADKWAKQYVRITIAEEV